MDIIVVIGLYLAGFDAVVEQIVIGKDGKDFQHTFHVIGIVKKQHMVKIVIVGGKIIMINTDQLTAGISIFSRNSEEVFNGFLFAVWKLQKVFVGIDALIDINPLKFVEIIGQIISDQFFPQVRKVKAVSIVMDQIRIIFCKREKSF